MTDLVARLAAYEPDGPRFATPLLDPSSWDATFAFNDAGSLQVKYARDLDPIGMLGRPVELAAELWDGTTWVEPRNARYVATEDQSDDAADLDVASYTLKSYATLLNRVQVLARPDNPVFPDTDRPDYTDDGSREFWTATAGQVVLSLLNEHRQRYGTLPALTVDFTSTHDSAGQPWAEVRSLTYSPSTGLFDVLADLASYSLIDWWMEGRTLRVLNAGTQQVDRTVHMHLVDAESAPVRGSWDGMATVVRLEGVDGQVWEKAVPGAPAWWGPRVRTIVNSSVADDATAQAILENEALLAAAKRTEYTRTLKDFKQRPLLDFQMGDTIPAKNALGVFEQMRVFEIGLSLDTDGLLSSTLTLNDRFVDADVRFQRRLKGATSGADDVGGDGSIPNNLTPAVPAQVKGLTVGTLGYWKGSVPRSSVQVDWADVTADVNGYAIELLRYDVEVAGRTTAVPAADIGQKPPSQAGITNLDIDTPVVVRVRAVSATGVPGAWSASVSIVTDRPYQPMDPPTSLALSVENGIVTVAWDGKLEGSGDPYSPPSYFDRVDVYEATASSGPWTRVGTIRAGMLVLDRQSTVGETRFYRGVALDVLAVESPAGPTSSITVTSAVSEAVSAAQQKADDALAQLAGTKSSTLGQKVAAAVTATQDEYALGDSETTAPTSGWSTTPPVRTPGTFIWVRTTVTYGDGNSTMTSPVLITGNTGAKGDKGDRGADGVPGKDGVGLTGTAVSYVLSTSGTTTPTSGWSSTVPTLVKGRYLWTRSVWSYSDGSSETGYSVAYIGTDGSSGTDGLPGKDGVGITGTVIAYAVSSSGTTAPSSGWQSTPPAASAGQFMWTRTTWTYSDASTEVGYSVGKIGETGSTGATGTSVTSVTSYYRTAATGTAEPDKPTTNPPPSPWATTEPGFVAGVELYRTDRILYSTGTFAYTDVSKVSAYTAALQAMSAANAAQTTANGLNARITSQTAPASRPNGTPLANGDEWLVANASAQIVGVLIWNGTTWNPYVLLGDSVLVPSSIGTISLAGGAVTAPKLFVDQAMIDALAVGDLWAGKITTQMFSTQAAFSGPGVKIDRTGVVTTRSDGSTVTQSADGILVKDPSGEELVRLGYGISTGLAVRNPVSGSMVELAWQAFVAQSAYGDDSSSPNGAGSGITEYWNANESVYEDFNTKYIPYGPVVTFTTGWTGNIEIATGGKVAITCKSTCNEAGSAIANLALYLAPEILSGTTQVVAPQRFAGGFIQASSLASGSGNSDVDNVLMSLSGSTRLSLTPNTTYTARIRVCLNRYIFFSGANRANASLSLEKMWISVRQIA